MTRSAPMTLVQAALTKLYVHWGRAQAADHPDVCARTVLVHEFIQERRSLLRHPPFPPHGTCSPHDPSTRNTREIINGYRVVVKRMPAGGHPEQELCAAHADGLWVSIIEFGRHPSMGVVSLFRQHLRLLGTSPAGWTRDPLTVSRG
jgi:hypothetical protein